MIALATHAAGKVTEQCNALSYKQQRLHICCRTPEISHPEERKGGGGGDLLREAAQSILSKLRLSRSQSAGHRRIDNCIWHASWQGRPPKHATPYAWTIPHQVTQGLSCHHCQGACPRYSKQGPTDSDSHLLGEGCGCIHSSDSHLLGRSCGGIHDCIGTCCRRQGPPGMQAPVAQGVGGCRPQQRREVILHPCAGQICVQQPGVHSDSCICMPRGRLVPAASSAIIMEWQCMSTRYFDHD